jgi:hypothetical protein
MAWGLTIGGVSRKTNVHEPDGVEIVLPHNERGTARFTTNPGYVPPLRSEVIIYDTDGTTPLFGGVLFQRSARGQQGSNAFLWTECECSDWTWYLDRITIPGGSIDTPWITLKEGLEWLITNLLSPYGFTLDPTQATGPAGPWKFEWERKYVSEILRDMSQASGGWVWRVSPAKQLRMDPPTIVTPTAPFSITDSNQKAHTLTWVETSEHYATRVILRCGGDGTKSVTETWTLTSGLIAQGYLETTAPSTQTGPISATINGSPATIGTSGTQLIWTWDTHRITAGTYTPVVGHVIAVTYTAQYPYEVIADSGVTPPIDIVLDQPDLTEPATARLTADGLLVKHQTSPRTFDVVTFTNGLRPGQVLSIDSPNSASASTTALITEVRIHLMKDNLWRHQATAISGIYQGSPLDYFRGLGGTATGSTLIITNAPAPGGSKSGPYVLATGLEFVRWSTSSVWVPASPMIVTLTSSAGASATVFCRLRALAATVSVQARLRNLDTATTVGTSAVVTSTDWTDANFSAALTDGTYRYQLELLAGSANADVGAVAYVE